MWWLASLLSFCVAYIGRDLALIAMYAPVFGVIFAIVALRNGVLFVMRYLQLRETEELDLLVWCIWAVMLVCVTALLYLFGLHFASIVCAVILGGVALECVRKWWEWYVESLAFIPESENDPYDVPPAA